MVKKLNFVLEDEEFSFNTNVEMIKENNGDFVLVISCPRMDEEPILHLTINKKEVEQFRDMFNEILKD